MAVLCAWGAGALLRSATCVAAEHAYMRATVAARPLWVPCDCIQLTAPGYQ